LVRKNITCYESRGKGLRPQAAEITSTITNVQNNAHRHIEEIDFLKQAILREPEAAAVVANISRSCM
jgi:hypothetical protein